MPKATDFERFSRVVIDQFKRMDMRFDGVDSHLAESEGRLTSIESELRDIRQQLETLEEAAVNLSGFAKEIDHLLKRVAAIEKHLGLQHNIRA